MKKLLLGLGAMTAIAAPVVVAVSCGDGNNDEGSNPARGLTAHDAAYNATTKTISIKVDELAWGEVLGQIYLRNKFVVDENGVLSVVEDFPIYSQSALQSYKDKLFTATTKLAGQVNAHPEATKISLDIYQGGVKTESLVYDISNDETSRRFISNIEYLDEINNDLQTTTTISTLGEARDLIEANKTKYISVWQEFITYSTGTMPTYEEALAEYHDEEPDGNDFDNISEAQYNSMNMAGRFVGTTLNEVKVRVTSTELLAASIIFDLYTETLDREAENLNNTNFDEINWATVRTISEYTFEHAVFPDGFAIPATVTTIEQNAFGYAVFSNNFVKPTGTGIHQYAFYSATHKDGSPLQ